MLQCVFFFFFFQAEDGIRYLVRSRGLGDVYKRQDRMTAGSVVASRKPCAVRGCLPIGCFSVSSQSRSCLLYTSDAADERSSVDLGGRRIIKKKNKIKNVWG